MWGLLVVRLVQELYRHVFEQAHPNLAVLARQFVEEQVVFALKTPSF